MHLHLITILLALFFFSIHVKVMHSSSIRSDHLHLPSPSPPSDCGPNEFWNEQPYACGFKCTGSGIEYKCERARRSPGCDCHFGFHLNMDTKKCEKIKCKTMDCAGRANEMHFECESR
jgi:hypothetical protein